MSSTEQAPEPTMDEILASIRRIIADDEASSGSRPAPKPAAPARREPERPRPQAKPASLVDDIAHALREEEAPAREPEDDILDLTEVFEADRAAPASLALPEADQLRPPRPELRPRNPVWESPMPSPAPTRPELHEPHPQPDPRVVARERIVDVATVSAMTASVEAERSFMGYAEEPFGKREEPRFEDDVEEVETPPAPAAFAPEAPAPSWEKETRNGTAKTLEDSVREMLRPLLRDWLDNNLPRILESAVREELAVQVREKRRQH